LWDFLITKLQELVKIQVKCCYKVFAVAFSSNEQERRIARDSVIDNNTEGSCRKITLRENYIIL